MEEATILYRPVGQGELDLILESGFRAFPPRFFWQPIFYPVLTEAYAADIARKWNTKEALSGYVGYATRFRVRTEFLTRYPVRDAAGRECQEYWIPAEELTEFNANIVDPIEIVTEFRANSEVSGSAPVNEEP